MPEIKICVFTLLSFLLLLACGDSDNNLAQDVQVSDCGGFDAPSARLMDDELDCGDEMLSFQYDESTQMLTLLHENLYLNCCGNHAVQVTELEDGSGFEVKETDDPMDEGRCACMCLFDNSAKIQLLSSASINVKVIVYVSDSDSPKRTVWQGSIDPADGSGSVLIREDASYCNAQ